MAPSWHRHPPARGDEPEPQQPAVPTDGPAVEAASEPSQQSGGDQAGFEPGQRSTGYRSRTALLFVLAEIVGKLASFVMFAVAARLLGPDGFGEFSWAMGLGAMVASLGMFGFDMALIQLGGANPAKTANYLTSSVALRTVIAAISLGVLAVLPLEAAGSKTALLLLAAALSLENISSAVRAAAGVLDRQRGAAVNITIQRITVAAVAIGVLAAGGGVVGMAAAFLIGTGVGTVTMLVLAHIIGATPHWRALSFQDTKDLTVRAVLPGLANTMNMQTARVDVIALARSTSYSNVGYFSAAYKLMETSLFLSGSLIRAAMPALIYAKNPRRVGEIVRAVLSTGAVFYFPLATVMIVRGGQVIGLFFGPEYSEGGRTAMIALAFGLISLVTLQALTTALLVRRRSVDVAAVAGATLGVKLIIVWPLVDRWGPLGAGLAVLLAYTTQAGLLWWRLARYGGRPKLGLSLVPAFVACLVMTPVLLSDLPLIPAGLIAAGLYCGSWWALAARLDADSITRLMATFGR